MTRVLTRMIAACLAALTPAGSNAAAPEEAAAEAPRLIFLFEETVLLGESTKAGKTPYGDRNIVPITGGTITGPYLTGKVRPGGWDWQLAAPGGCFTLKADYMIEAADGTIINVLNQGAFCKSQGGPTSRSFTSPRFEAPVGKYGWLNDGAYVGTLAPATVAGRPAVRIRFYKAG